MADVSSGSVVVGDAASNRTVTARSRLRLIAAIVTIVTTCDGQTTLRSRPWW